jgi:hypothetical protein
MTSSWTEITTSLFDESYCYVRNYKLNGDTTINDMKYTKIYLNNILYDAALRETSDNKVYAYFYSLEAERLAYDFNWEVGKTICSEYYEPQEDDYCVEIMQIDNIQLLDGNYYQQIPDIIKGIGNTKGFFWGMQPALPNGDQCALLCFSRNGQLVYKNNLYKTCDDCEKAGSGFAPSWSVLNYGLGANNIPCCVSTEYIYLDSDSIADGKTYKKVFSCNDRLHENVKYEGIVREQGLKTYFIPADSETEYLLYDFSLEQGMTFEYQSFREGADSQLSFYAENVDFVEINGEARKRIQIGVVSFSSYSEIIDTWIEGIGSLNGFLYPCYKMFMTGGVRELLCHYDNNELVYQNPVYSECYYDKVEDITSVQTTAINDYGIFPNPVDDLLNISCLNNNIITRIEIFDSSGQQVYSQTGKDAINVSSFAKGLYLLKVYDTNEQISIFRIIKK